MYIRITLQLDRRSILSGELLCVKTFLDPSRASDRSGNSLAVLSSSEETDFSKYLDRY